jgi:hypothetical protein
MRGYHGTPHEFERFRDPLGDEKSRYQHATALGTHFAKDPRISESFMTERDPWTGDPSVKPGSRMIQVRLPPKERFLEVHQPEHGHVDPGRPHYERLLHDDWAVNRMVAEEAIRADPSLLTQYLIDARRIPENEAAKMSAQLTAGEKVQIHEGHSPYDLREFIANYGFTPYSDQGRTRMIELARKSWKDKGYAGLKYINTSSVETKNAEDYTSYILFDASGLLDEPARGAK